MKNSFVCKYIELGRKGWRWVLLCLLSVCLFSVVLFHADEDLIRFTGLLFQMSGFFIAAFDVYLLKKKFGVENLKTRAVNFLKSFLPRVPKEVVPVGVAKMTTATGVPQVTTESSIVLSLEERLAKLEDDVEKKNKILEEKIEKLKNKFTEKLKGIDKYSSEIDSRLSSLSGLVVSLFVEDALSSEVAIALFVIGSVMSTFPSWFMCA